jgi:hypothetical protein
LVAKAIIHQLYITFIRGRAFMGKKTDEGRKTAYNTPTLWVHGGIEQLTKTIGKKGIHPDTRGKIGDFRTS